MQGYRDAILDSAGWRTTDICEGKACTYIRLEYAAGENLLKNEPQFTADITGTETSNPGAALKDLLLTERYGKGLLEAKINLSAIDAVISVSNTDVETVIDSGVMRDLFTCNVALDTQNSVFDNVNTILKSFRGLLPIIDGRLKPIVEKDDVPVSLEILDRDILALGEIKNSNKTQRFNRVVVSYRSGEEKGTKQEAVYPPKDSQIETDWLDEDNGVVLEKKTDLDTCDNFFEALAFAKSLAEISREQLKTEITLPIWGTLFEVGDIVKITHSKVGWNQKPFRIDVTNESDTEVVLSVREHQPYIYDFENTQTKPSYPDTSSTLTLPAAPSNITKLELYTQLKQLSISWTGTTTRYNVVIKNIDNAIIYSETIARKFVEIRNYEFGTYTITVIAQGPLLASAPTSLSFDIDQELKGFIWQIYADNDQGLNASITDSTKAFVGIAFFREVETPSLEDLTVYKVWLPNTSSRWIYGTGEPASNEGSIGDNFLDTNTNDVYTKTPSGWVPVANFGNGDGDGFFSGPNNPLASFGADGNTFLNLTSYELFKKANGSWVSQGIIKGEEGAKGDTGDAGPQGVRGPDGPNGEPRYTWIKYGTSSTGANISNNPSNKTWIGFAYNKTTETETFTPSDYTWSLIQGAAGNQGVRGVDGIDGRPSYTWIKYSANANGAGLTDLPQSNTKYIGIRANQTDPNEIATASLYIWSLFKGDKGNTGEIGAPGQPGASSPDAQTQRAQGGSVESVVNSWKELMRINIPQGIGGFNQTISVNVSGYAFNGSQGAPVDVPFTLRVRLTSTGNPVSSGQENYVGDLRVFGAYRRTPAQYANSTAQWYSIEARMEVNGAYTDVFWNWSGTWIAARN
jgi:hypothetical protein